MSTTYYVTPFDYDFGPEALAVFRKWLEKQYGTLAALNRQWDTSFASWDAVMPLTAFEVKGRGNYAPWADHRAFMDDSFVGFFQWTRDRLRERDLGAPPVPAELIGRGRLILDADGAFLGFGVELRQRADSKGIVGSLLVPFHVQAVFRDDLPILRRDHRRVPHVPPQRLKERVNKRLANLRLLDAG